MKKRIIHTAAIVAATLTLQAQDYTKLITEEFLRSEFTFANDEKLKYSKCEPDNGCKYIWGKPNYQDKVNMKYGGFPLGQEVKISILDGVNKSDFEEGFNNPDVWRKEDVGSVAVWSDNKKRLIVLSSSNKMISINIINIEDSKIKEHAIAVAKHIISQLK